MADFERIVRMLLEQAGIAIDGTSPWDIKVHHSGFYQRVLTQGTLGLGESFMEGWWTCDAVDEFFNKILRAELHKKVAIPFSKKVSLLAHQVINMQTIAKARKVVDVHYDIGSEIILSFLDPYNQYTSGYFKGTDDLNKAQEQKLDLICRKLMLKPKDKVLDIGCGWGGFARFAAERYHCEVTGISNSGEQIAYAKAFCEGLPNTFFESDYRELEGKFNKVLVCGMIEHVGCKNYRTLMKKVWDCLDDDGIFLLHTIGGNTSVSAGDQWLMKYIFPNSMLPSMRQIADAVEGLFVMEDIHNFGQYYDPTLMAWHHNFVRNWPAIKHRYDETFFRMWTYYFLHMAGTFRARLNQLWQFVFSKKGIPGGYQSLR
jgi:cyclopropane-fatty-acyl-phospholipid synthase